MVHFDNIETEAYETYSGVKQTKTTTQVYNQNRTMRCEVICWGNKGDTTVRFLEGSITLKCLYRADFGTYESALGAVYKYFNEKIAA